MEGLAFELCRWDEQHKSRGKGGCFKTLLISCSFVSCMFPWLPCPPPQGPQKPLFSLGMTFYPGLYPIHFLYSGYEDRLDAFLCVSGSSPFWVVAIEEDCVVFRHALRWWGGKCCSSTTKDRGHMLTVRHDYFSELYSQKWVLWSYPKGKSKRFSLVILMSCWFSFIFQPSFFLTMVKILINKSWSIKWLSMHLLSKVFAF